MEQSIVKTTIIPKILLSILATLFQSSDFLRLTKNELSNSLRKLVQLKMKAMSVSDVKHKI